MRRNCVQIQHAQQVVVCRMLVEQLQALHQHFELGARPLEGIVRRLVRMELARGAELQVAAHLA